MLIVFVRNLSYMVVPLNNQFLRLILRKFNQRICLENSKTNTFFNGFNVHIAYKCFWR